MHLSMSPEVMRTFIRRSNSLTLPNLLGHQLLAATRRRQIALEPASTQTHHQNPHEELS